MHRCQLGGGGHSSKRVIHVLATGFIGTQKAEGGRITCGNEWPEGRIIWGAEEFGFSRVASEGERLPVAGQEVLEVRFSFRTLEAASQLV
eukprot:2074629-Pleurochrysis_carterae.AAC.1